MCKHFKVEFRVPGTPHGVRAVVMSLRSLFDNIPGMAEGASSLEIAIAEGMNNVVFHAYDRGSSGDLRVIAELEASELRVQIFDQGHAPDPDRISEVPPNFSSSTPVDSLSCDGRGLMLMRQIMDSVEHDRLGDENRLTLTKRTQA